MTSNGALVCVAPELERIQEAVRMATYNAESALAHFLTDPHGRSGEAARSLLRDAFRTSAELQIIGDELHVRLQPISAPRDSRAIAALCAELTATNTLYPGTESHARLHGGSTT